MIVHTIVNYLVGSHPGENHSERHRRRYGVRRYFLFDQIVRIHVGIKIADAKYKILKT